MLKIILMSQAKRKRLILKENLPDNLTVRPQKSQVFHVCLYGIMLFSKEKSSFACKCHMWSSRVKLRGSKCQDKARVIVKMEWQLITYVSLWRLPHRPLVQAFISTGGQYIIRCSHHPCTIPASTCPHVLLTKHVLSFKWVSFKAFHRDAASCAKVN